MKVEAEYYLLFITTMNPIIKPSAILEVMLLFHNTDNLMSDSHQAVPQTECLYKVPIGSKVFCGPCLHKSLRLLITGPLHNAQAIRIQKI